MAAVGVSAACSQAGTSFLRDGDPVCAVTSLFFGEGLRSLGTAMATAGLVGTGGAVSFQNFGERLMVNGLRSVVKASVSSVIEGRDLGNALKSAGLSALVDTISGSIAARQLLARVPLMNQIRRHLLGQRFSHRDNNDIAELPVGLGIGNRDLEGGLFWPVKPHQAGALARGEAAGVLAVLLDQDFRAVLAICVPSPCGRNRFPSFP